MFIDYVPLLLLNMAAGLFLLAGYVLKGIDSPDQKKWGAGFLISGIVALVFGGHMTITWPLPGSYNIAFGQMSVLLGVLFLGAGLSLVNNWNLLSVAIYGLFAAIAAVIIGLRIVNMKMTQEPLVSGIGFILTGLSGILVLPALNRRKMSGLKIIIAILLICAGLIWLRTCYGAYWHHLSSFSNWKPVTMR